MDGNRGSVRGGGSFIGEYLVASREICSRKRPCHFAVLSMALPTFRMFSWKHFSLGKTADLADIGLFWRPACLHLVVEGEKKNIFNIVTDRTTVFADAASGSGAGS